ncbi:MAG: galactokinase, partial [Bacteroidetes bacterium]
MDISKYKNILTKFQEQFTNKPLVIRSPGRINLIGEHTDYNDGFVLPAAIDKEILVALAPNQTDICNLFSWDLQEQVSFQLDDLKKSSSNWANYIIGVVQQLVQSKYPVKGFDCVFGGDIPIGAGLSSSAALECGVAYGLSQLWAFDISKLEIAQLAQRAEREFVGVQCGLMDQYANMFGEEGHLIQLDCRDLTHEAVKVD